MSSENSKKVCYYCGEAVLCCIVCKLQIYQKQKIGQCPNCQGIAHFAHLQEWLKTQGKCPTCLKAVKKEAIIIVDPDELKKKAKSKESKEALVRIIREELREIIREEVEKATNKLEKRIKNKIEKEIGYQAISKAQGKIIKTGSQKQREDKEDTVCPACGNKAKFMKNLQKWYCKTCSKYLF